MKKPAYVILFISLLIALSSFQQKNEIIKGDLYFSFFRFGSFYNQSDSLANNFIMYADTANRANVKDLEKTILDMYDVLKKEHLLYSPFVDLKLNNDSVIKLYLHKPDYDKIKIYKLKQLQDKNKKVCIEAEVKHLGGYLFFCEKLISVKKEHGETFEVPSKFKIEDYY